MKSADLKRIVKEEIQNIIKENSQWEVETQKFEIVLKKWLDFMIRQGDTVESLKPEIDRMLDTYNQTGDTLMEHIKSGNELKILLNAANNINTKFFNNRGQIDRSNYTMIVRNPAYNVLDILEKNTKVIKKINGFTAKEDEEQTYYQLPDFNVAIALDSYKVSRATVIQFLSFEGEKPKADRMF